MGTDDRPRPLQALRPVGFDHCRSLPGRVPVRVDTPVGRALPSLEPWRPYDYIVVGAGTAGCVVASRLSEDPGVSVLLVEAGGSDRTPMLTMPAALPFVYQSKRVQWGYQSGPEPELSGREIDEKSGRVLGGTSSINAMIFNRGNPLDYDGWAADGLVDVGLRPLPALLQADGDVRRRS